MFMNYDQLIKQFGTQVKAADAIGVSQVAISQWRTKGIPLGRQYQLQIITGGALLADAPAKK